MGSSMKSTNTRLKTFVGKNAELNKSTRGKLKRQSFILNLLFLIFAVLPGESKKSLGVWRAVE